MGEKRVLMTGSRPLGRRKRTLPLTEWYPDRVSGQIIGATRRPLGHRQREQEWRRTHGDVLCGYAGEWLVLEGEEIIAHGDDPAALVTQARERGIRSPYVFFVEPAQPGVVKIGI